VRCGKMRCVNLTVRWLWTVAGVLLAGLVATVVWGVSAAKFGGQSATESYILTCLLTLISISTGIVVTFIVSQHQANEHEATQQRQREDLERSARSAVIRFFRILGVFGRIQEVSGDPKLSPADLRMNTMIVADLAKQYFAQTEDSIQDWRGVAEAAVDKEMDRVKSEERNQVYE